MAGGDMAPPAMQKSEMHPVESAQEVGLIKMRTGQRVDNFFDLNRNHVTAREFRHIKHRADDALS